MDLKLLQARDTIMAVMKAIKLTTDEQRKVLQMCNDEINAWEKREKLKEMNKDGDE